MENKDKKSVNVAIKLLEQEIQELRTQGNYTQNESTRIMCNNQMLSYILAIQHLRECINQDENQDENI